MPEYQLPNFIAVEGNIGAGKTTFAKLLAQRTNRRLILETFDDNPFLPPFYREPERYALPVELFFMTERHKQLTAELARADLFSNGAVADYIFVKTLLFARNTLAAEEFRLFSRIFGTMDAGFPDPDVIVYLHRPVSILQRNIAERGREYEQSITPEYLSSVERAYRSYLGAQKETPVVMVDLGDQDFINDRRVYDKIMSAVRRAPEVGVLRISLSNQS